MKITLLPLYSKENPDPQTCPLLCQGECKVKNKAPDGKNPCPLSWHQAQTCGEVLYGDAEVIFNKAATGDGKSLAAYLPGLLNPTFRIIGLYPTIELVTDQEKQIENYHSWFGLNAAQRVDSLYGAELARRVEQAEKGNRFKELLRSLRQQPIILTNPDIFHFISHFRYHNPAYNRAELPIALARSPDLYVADEFPIFGVHQEAAILNSLLLIRHNRPRKRPLKVLFTSATPKPNFIDKLKSAGFKVVEVPGNYVWEPTLGYRRILQQVELEFVQLPKDADSLSWFTDAADKIGNILKAENKGRGLIILNSVALVSRIVHQIQALLPDVKVREISGRIDHNQRAQTQAELKNATQTVLVVATSAADVGVDFDIHLLIFEASDSATFIQRLGRLGRHQGFSVYQAFVLVNSRTPWVISRLQEKLEPSQFIDRIHFREIIEEAFTPAREFEQYRQYWGALQAQGMLLSMSRGDSLVMKPLSDSISNDLRRVYGEQLDKKRGHWFALSDNPTGKAVQEELLRFRGGSDLQAAVWDNSRFYTYDLLRILPYVAVEIIEREEFLLAAQQCERTKSEFPEKYIQVYLKVQRPLEQRLQIELECERGTDELKQCTLFLIDKLIITGHQSEVQRCLRKCKLLTFLVPVNHRDRNSHWDVMRTLHLSPMFGLYRLTDADNQAYACAFNQDALLLEALKWRLKRCETTKPYIF